MDAYRPTLYGTRHAISAGHYLATMAGFSVLEAGGNAIDAGCAAGIALGVLQPDLVHFAGVAPIILRTADGTVETIAGLGHWPRALPPDGFAATGEIPLGVQRTVVPAAPDAWITALIRHGTMTFGDVASFAIRYAAEGFAVYPLLLQSITQGADGFRRFPDNAALFLPDGQPPALGSKFVQTDLAGTLTFMAAEERVAGGDRVAGLRAARDAFYRGDIAVAIARHQRENGGWLSEADLAAFHSPVEPAIRRRWRGHDVMTCGPWCQGPALLHALLLVEQVGIAGLRHNSPEYLHVLVECLKLAMADREYFYGDPNFIDVPIDSLLAPATIAQRARQVQSERAHPGMPPPMQGDAGAPLPSGADLPRVEADTSYVCAVDRWGNAFSATPSDGCGNAPMVPGLGLVPSTRGSQSRPDRSHPAGVAPGKRPRLTPAPALVVTDEGGAMPLGTPGGDVQVQAMLQVLLNVLHFGMELQPAIEAPRVASYSFPSSFAPFEYFPGRLAVEGRVAPETRARLRALGHHVVDWPDFTWLSGSVEAVLAQPGSGLIAAGADPRRPAYAAAI